MAFIVAKTKQKRPATIAGRFSTSINRPKTIGNRPGENLQRLATRLIGSAGTSFASLCSAGVSLKPRAVE